MFTYACVCLSVSVLVCVVALMMVISAKFQLIHEKKWTFKITNAHY